MKEPYNKKIDKEKHKMVKVELVNSKKIELHNPYLQGEDLIGVIITENRERFKKDTLSITLKDINHMSWYVGKEPYNKQINEEKPRLVEVELINGKKIELHNPYLQSDDLIGVIITENRERFQKHTVSISLLHIKQIKEKEIDAGVTVIFILLCLGIVAGVTYAILSSIEWNFPSSMEWER